jgi:S1-C subfamily serine protease
MSGRRRCLGGWSAILLAAAIMLPDMPAAAAAEQKSALTPALLDAIVRIETHVPTDARTAGYLGTKRDGSGVVIDSDGLILTVGYLVTEAMGAQLTTRQGKTVPAAVVGLDNDSGLGLLRATEPLGVKPLRLGHAKGLGEKTMALIASGSNVQAATIVSRRAFAGSWEYLLDDAIFTAPAFDEWGGAALIGADGRLLGIGSLLVPDARPGRMPEAGNMFIPVDRLLPVLGDLLTLGRPGSVGHPWLGMNVAAIDGTLLVMRVSADGPAAKAGVTHGDRVLAVAGHQVKDLADFYRKIWALGSAGVTVPLALEQDGARRDVKIPRSIATAISSWIRATSVAASPRR